MVFLFFRLLGHNGFFFLLIAGLQILFRGRDISFQLLFRDRDILFRVLDVNSIFKIKNLNFKAVSKNMLKLVCDGTG